MPTILLISPFWKEPHRWMVSSVKLAALWQRLGYHVVVVCMGSQTGVEQVSDTLVIHRRRDMFLPDPWNYGIAFGFAGYVRRLAADLNPDHIVINKVLFWSSLAAIPLRLTGRRITVLTDALVGITWFPRGLLPRIGSVLYAWTLGWLILRVASRVVFFHPQPASVLRRLGITRKATVIPTGIDVSSLQTAVNNVRSTVNVTYVGRLESVKGVDDLLAAVVPLKREYDLEVQVVGWYKDRHPLVEQYQRDVRFTGLRDDVPAILAESDIFVLPSHSEGLSNALMEAMAAGRACVASDVGGNSFLIQNGVSGFLYPPGDRAALAAHIRRLLDDPAKRRAMGEAARRRITEQFSWEKVGKMYEEFFGASA
jgi:glycosyltransferase involved in cell wall biosynthesis